MNREEFLAPYQTKPNELFSSTFLKRWGKKEWEPSRGDRRAGAMLHTQITSRITTQRLGYLDGVEKTALDSVYELFKTTRRINDRFPDAQHFEAVAWEVLNMRVRPFTAKWHSKSERGALAALDATDEFRAQLIQLQDVLRRFDNLLQKLHDENAPAAIDESLGEPGDQITREMAEKVEYGIPINYGGLDPSHARDINERERKDRPDICALTEAKLSCTIQPKGQESGQSSQER